MTGQSTSAQAPTGVNHLVLNVSNLGESHRFWTEVMGFVQTGEMAPESGMRMRFYRGGDASHHHDLALNEIDPGGDESGEWSMRAARPGINHVAIAYPDRDSWLRQLEHLQAHGVRFHVRGEHGMSHSAYISDPDGIGIEVLYELPADAWEGDLNAAFNYFRLLPREGEAALEDSTEYPVFGGTT